MLLSSALLIAGCSDKEEEDTNDTVAITYAEGDTYKVPDVNYEGKNFNVLTWTQSEDWVQELTSELSNVEQETYRHLKTVEQELNLKFSVTEQAGSYNDMGDFVAKLDTIIQSGDEGVDLVCQYSLCASRGTERGFYEDLTKVDYINWNAEYWSQNLKDTNTINGKMYYCTGDMTASTVKAMVLMTYDYDKAQNNQMGDLYALVKEGKWTIEKLKTLSAGIYEDTNNNNIADVGDNFGLVTGDYTVYDAFQYGCNLYAIKTNSMGEIEINSDLYGDRGVAVVEKITDLLHNNGKASYAATYERKVWNTALEEQKTVFNQTTAARIMDSLVKSDVNYGMLPMPKYDEDQDGYYTCLSMLYSMFSIPICANDKNVSAAVLESMAHNGYTNLSPVVFEALQYRYSKRAEDVEMLELTRDGIVYEPGRILDTLDIFGFVRHCVREQESVTAYWASNKKTLNSNLESTIFMFS